MSEKDFIPITETPYVTKLAKDFLLGKDIGINNPLTTDYKGLIEKAAAKEFSDTKRELLANAILEQYKRDGVEPEANSKVYQNIQSLKESKTFSFTTGQQIHIFLGPLFFIYKIQSLLRHVNNFNVESKLYKAVPIFWMASEDHDLEEIGHVKLYGETFKWETEAGNAVGRMRCEGLPELIDKIEDRADTIEENTKLFALFKKHYRHNKTLAAATRSLLDEIFGDEGLIIIDPDDKTLKQSFSDIAGKEIEENILYNSYNEQNSKLKKQGFEPVVNAQEINYFWLEDNKRVKLKIKDNTILKGASGQQLSLDQIIQNIENLSPNVISRPLYQETVLPNIAYVGGSAEIEYWLPLQSSFKTLGLQFPALIRRDSAVLISEKNIHFIEKAGFELKDIYRPEKELASVFSERHNESSGQLTDNVGFIKAHLSKLKEKLEEQEFKNGIIYKEIRELDKGLSKLANAISDEQLKLQKEKDIFNKLLKIKSRFFDQIQERNEFVISYPGVLKIKYTGLNEFKLICLLRFPNL